MDVIKRLWCDICKYYEFIKYRTKCQLKSDVIDTKLGWIWWILEPLCFMFIYLFVFMYLFKTKEDAYALFIFLGVTIWNFFSDCLKKSTNLVKNDLSIIRNVYLPKTILAIQMIVYNSFKLIISIAISFILMLYYKKNISFSIIYLMLIVLILFLLTFGVSCILMHFGVYIRDMQNVINIAIKMMFYLTGIFYSIPKRFPFPYNQYVLGINPIALLIDEARNIFIIGKINRIEYLIAWLIISIAISYFGATIVYKNENAYLKVS